MKPRRIFVSLCLAGTLLGLARTAAAQQEVLVSTTAVDAVASRHGLIVLGRDDRHKVYRLRVPEGSTAAAVLAALARDPQVANAEVHARVSLQKLVGLDQSTVGVLNQSTVAVLNQSTVAVLNQSTVGVLNQSTVGVLNQSTVGVLNSLLDLGPVPFYGSTVAGGYLAQPAMKVIQNAAAHSLSTGIGVMVADIDNGLDPGHPVYQGFLAPGFNFINNSSDVSVFSGLDASTIKLINQPLDLSQSTVGVLNQSTVAVLNQSTVGVLNSLPPAFGHGTAVAGVLRLVAPQSRIMPLKAFGADGTGFLFDVIRALYYAVDQGAQVVNMSFTCDCNSRELAAAIRYAEDQGVLLVGSAGNDGALTRLFPAAYTNVLGIAATNFDDSRAWFSNYGSSVFASAPGTGVITAYPGGKYAAVWGTSFSAPMVAGQAALLFERGLRASDIARRIRNTAVDNTSLNAGTYIGHGRINLYQAVQGN